MRRSKRLSAVIKLAQNREKQAVRQMGVSRQHLDLQLQTLEELVTYRSEYTREFQDAMKTGLGALSMQDYHQFLIRLNEAIQQQQEQVNMATQDHELSRQLWLDSRCHSKGVAKVAERYQNQERKQQQQQEQRENDERWQHPKSFGLD